MLPSPIAVNSTRLVRLPWAAAVRAGFSASLAATLVVSLLLAGCWAGHTDFPGHHHPAGTPDHHHTLLQVSGAPAVPAPVAVSGNDRLVEYLAPLLWVTLILQVQVASPALARGPPTSSV